LGFEVRHEMRREVTDGPQDKLNMLDVKYAEG
jgi:hypothetical protein